MPDVPFRVEAAAGVWDIPRDEARRALDGLSAWALLTREVTNGHEEPCYRLHRLLCDYAVERADPAELETARQRHAAYYAGFAKVQDKRYVAGEQVAALAALDGAMENIRAGWTWATRPGEEAWDLARRYAFATMQYLDMRGLWDDALAWRETGLRSCQALGDEGGTAGMLGNLGSVVGQASTWWNLALVYEKQGKLTEAIELMEKTVAIEKRIGHPDAEKDERYVEELRLREKKAEERGWRRMAVSRNITLYIVPKTEEACQIVVSVEAEVCYAVTGAGKLLLAGLPPAPGGAIMNSG